MKKKHQKVLERIFTDPTQASIAWHDIEALFASLGASIDEGAGSRVIVELHDIVAVFHRPHSQKESDKGAVKSVRRFLIEAGVKQC